MIPTLSEVNLKFIKPRDGLIAFASVVIDDWLYLSGIGVHEKLDGSGYRLTYPTRPVTKQAITLFHPITKDASRAIEQAIINKLKDVMSKANAGHHRPDAART